MDQALDVNFLANDLNRLIFKLIGLSDFVQPYEMSMNSVGLYVLDPAVAERKVWVHPNIEYLFMSSRFLLLYKESRNVCNYGRYSVLQFKPLPFPFP